MVLTSTQPFSLISHDNTFFVWCVVVGYPLTHPTDQKKDPVSLTVLQLDNSQLACFTFTAMPFMSRFFPIDLPSFKFQPLHCLVSSSLCFHR